jgi:hypothetical protein
MPSVISANRLEDGAVVYLADEGNWADTLAAAKLLATKPEVTAGLEAAHRAVESNLVLDPLAVEVSEVPTGWRPMSLRNTIRAAGPSVKYAVGPAVARS